LRSVADTEDATHEVLLKALTKKPVFENTEHEKAWLIRVSINYCKDVLKSSWSKNTDLENIAEPVAENADPAESFDETLGLVMALPENLRVCVYLHYYEGYKTVEIAEFMKKPHSTVRNYLSDARKVLREKLGGGFNE
jgi:RNA polymerase sigma-70 factor (ECF subfamily)